MIAQRTYQVGIYARLSRDDERFGESVSIENQKLMLTQYCEQQGWTISDYYVDDGWTGTNFNRPDFQRLIDDVQNKQINLVIVKDDCVIIELNAESLIKCGFCAVSSIF